MSDLDRPTPPRGLEKVLIWTASVLEVVYFAPIAFVLMLVEAWLDRQHPPRLTCMTRGQAASVVRVK